MIDKLIKKLFKSILGSGHSHSYKKYSSSDYKKQNRYGKHGSNTYGNSHYKRKNTSHSFFSS